MTLFFMNENIVLNAYTGESFSGGWGGNTYAGDVTIKCGIQPLNSVELERVPELRRNKVHKKVYTETALQVQDRLTIDSETFEVWKTFDHKREGFLEHYKAYVEKVES